MTDPKSLKADGRQSCLERTQNKLNLLLLLLLLILLYKDDLISIITLILEMKNKNLYLTEILLLTHFQVLIVVLLENL